MDSSPIVLSHDAYAEVRRAVSDCTIAMLNAELAVLRAQAARDLIARKHGVDCPDGYQLDDKTYSVIPNART